MPSLFSWRAPGESEPQSLCRYIAVSLHRRASPQGRGERTLVEIVELAADRHAMGEPRHLYAEGRQGVGDVMGRRLTVDRGVERQHHFLDLAFGHAGDEALDAELLRADAIDRRERAAAHMVAGPQGARPF